MWRYEEETVRTTTREEILEGVNRLVASPWYGHTTDFTRLLGGVERNQEGEITGARTALMVWTLRSVCWTILINVEFYCCSIDSSVITSSSGSLILTHCTLNSSNTYYIMHKK